MHNYLNEAFRKLSYCPTENDVVDSEEIIRKFVTYIYSKNIIDDGDLTNLRFNMFQKSSLNDLRKLPPSKDALLLHISRCAYQTGWVWGNTLTQRNPPSAESWGWMLHQGHLQVRWTSLDVHQDLKTAICTCQCRTARCITCKCGKNNLKCLKFCNCARLCEKS